MGGGPADRVGLLGGGRGEDVADHGAIGETGSDDAAERGIVPRSAADHHRDLVRRLAGPDHSTLDAEHAVAVEIEEPGQ